MTLRYAHLSPAHLRDAVEAIGAFEDANRRHLAATSGDAAEVVNGSKSFDESWWPQRDSNPCRGLESKEEDSPAPLAPIRTDSSE